MQDIYDLDNNWWCAVPDGADAAYWLALHEHVWPKTIFELRLRLGERHVGSLAKARIIRSPYGALAQR